METLVLDLHEMDQMFLDEEGSVDHLLTWDIWKCKFLECAKKHEKNFKLDLNKSIKNLQKKIQDLDFNENYDPVLRQNLLNQLKEKLIVSYENSFLAARQEQIEKDEKPTSYFYSKIATAKKQTNLDILTFTEHGQKITTTDPTTILIQTHKFYQNLYDHEDIDENNQQWLLDHLNGHDGLSETSKNKLDEEIQDTEFYTAIKGMQNNKAPGIDGIPREFYQKFWHLIKDKFLLVIKKIQLFQKLTITQQQAVLKLLYKKAERDDLKNWRPISLLCTDYKIITKILANRLQLVLHEIINEDQTCGIPRRSIFSNLRLYRNIIAHSQQKRVRGYIIALDQEKAFDRVNHQFLIKIMEKFNFGPSFINWIRTIYSHNESFIMLNGHLSLPVTIRRGVRQGCPLSALLYLLTAEVLAEVLRQENDIKGYPLPGTKKSVKLAQYADDTALLLRDEESIILAFRLISIFESGSGSKLNSDKCEGFALHHLSKRDLKQLKTSIKIKWLKNEDPIKLLGIRFCRNYERTCAINFQEQLTKISDKIQHLSKRSLSIRGRAQVSNSLLTSKLWYISSILDMPTNILAAIEKQIFTYIWQNKPERILRKSMYTPLDQGGVGLLNIDAQQKALKLKSLNQIISTQSCTPSKYFSLYWVRQKLATLLPAPFYSLVNNKQPTCSPSEIPLFFKNCLKVLREYKKLCTLFNDITFAEQDAHKNNEVTNKQIYNSITEQAQKQAKYEPTCVRLYRDNYIGPGLSIKWENLWNLSFKTYCTNKMYEITWFLRHHALNTGDKIHKMYPPLRPKCQTCKLPGIEHILHAFVQCEYVHAIWKFLAPFFTKILEHEFTHYELSLGAYTSADVAIERKKLALLLTTTINYYIWWRRNKNKFDKNKTVITHTNTISLIIQQIKIIINAHHKTLMRENKPLRFAKLFCIESALCVLSTKNEPIHTL